MSTYHLSCHCQKHIIRITYPEGTRPFPKNEVCDCSFCVKFRIVWSITPAKDGKVEVIRGVGDHANQLKTHQFGSKMMYHKWCGDCGSYLFATEGSLLDLTKPLYFNLRGIRDDHFDLWEHPISLISFVNQGEPYKHVQLSDIPGAKDYLEERSKHLDGPSEIAVGSCHCQAIKFGVVAKPLGTGRIADCGCSICLGNGSLWIYPGRVNTFWSPSDPSSPYAPLETAIIEYGYGDKENRHYHCKQCGVNLYEYAARPTEDPRPPPTEGATRAPWEPENGHNGSFGLNISLLSNIAEYLEDVNGVGWDGEKRVEGFEGKTRRLESLKRSKSMRFREPPKYTLDI